MGRLGRRTFAIRRRGRPTTFVIGKTGDDGAPLAGGAGAGLEHDDAAAVVEEFEAGFARGLERIAKVLGRQSAFHLAAGRDQQAVGSVPKLVLGFGMMRLDFQRGLAEGERGGVGHANVFFCDGHVESPTLQFLFEDTSDEALSRWNRDDQPHREKLSP